MANWCTNTVTFSGPDENKVRQVFKRLEKKCNNTNLGQTLKWFKDDRYLFDINTDDTISFETKWGPAEQTILEIFNRYDVNGEYYYEEPGMSIYGAIFKIDNEVYSVNLDDEDLDPLDYNDELDCYTVSGIPIESDSDYLFGAIDNKMQRLISNRKTEKGLT